MKRLLLYTIKSILTHPGIIGWGVLFVLFWDVAGAYIQAPSFIKELSSALNQVPPEYQHSLEQTYYLRYASTWYASLVILSLSSVAIGVAYMLYYQTGTLPYLIRYSKLKISTYFTSLYSGNLIASLILELLLTAAATLMFSNNGLGMTVTPSNIGIIILAIVLASIFIISFSAFLNLLAIKLHAFKLQNLFNFIPSILGFLAFAMFAFATQTSPIAYYSNPYMTAEILLYYGFSGSFDFYTAGNEITLQLSPGLLTLSVIAWIVILNLINYILARRIHYARIEEGRMM